MTGCEEPAPLLNPEFSVDGTSLEVPADGGRMEITYTLENPVQDARVIAFSDDEWITMGNEREEGKIFFDVDPNEDEELREMYPEKFGDLPSSYTAVMPVSVSLSGAATDGAEYRYAFYKGDYSSATNVYDMAATLLGEGCPDPSAEFYFTDDSYDKPFTIMAVVCDKDGNFGELFREVFTISRDGKSPVEEYQN